MEIKKDRLAMSFVIKVARIYQVKANRMLFYNLNSEIETLRNHKWKYFEIKATEEELKRIGKYKNKHLYIAS